MTSRRAGLSAIGASVLLTAAWFAQASATTPTELHLGYSDWPSWAAWQVAIDKGWLRAAGLHVRFEWFDYAASIAAFSDGKLDGDLMTNGDALVLDAAGARNVMILPTDYSSGDDMIVAGPAIRDLKDLKGRRIAVEVGMVEHQLVLDGLRRMGMSPADVKLVNVKTEQGFELLASGAVDAVATWQPDAGRALRALPGAHPIYTSAQSPGLIYDVLAVSPASLAAHRAEYAKLIAIWDRVVRYVTAPTTRADALRIMAARADMPSAQYRLLLQGTHLIDLEEAGQVMSRRATLESLYGSSQVADQFNVTYAAYRQPQSVEDAIDARPVLAQSATLAAQQPYPVARHANLMARR